MVRTSASTQGSSRNRLSSHRSDDARWCSAKRTIIPTPAQHGRGKDHFSEPAWRYLLRSGIAPFERVRQSACSDIACERGGGLSRPGFRALIAELRASRRRFRIASASAAPITTDSMWTQNSGSALASRILARYGWIFAKVAKSLRGQRGTRRRRRLQLSPAMRPCPNNRAPSGTKRCGHYLMSQPYLRNSRG
jgi:hypothetical protein